MWGGPKGTGWHRPYLKQLILNDRSLGELHPFLLPSCRSFTAAAAASACRQGRCCAPTAGSTAISATSSDPVIIVAGAVSPLTGTPIIVVIAAVGDEVIVRIVAVPGLGATPPLPASSLPALLLLPLPSVAAPEDDRVRRTGRQQAGVVADLLEHGECRQHRLALVEGGGHRV